MSQVMLAPRACAGLARHGWLARTAATLRSWRRHLTETLGVPKLVVRSVAAPLGGNLIFVQGPKEAPASSVK